MTPTVTEVAVSRLLICPGRSPRFCDADAAQPTHAYQIHLYRATVLLDAPRIPSTVSIVTEIPARTRIPAATRGCSSLGSQAVRENEHFAVAELVLRKEFRAGFGVYLDFRVGKAGLDRSDGLDLVGNCDKKQFLAHCTAATGRSHGADLPTICHGSV